MIESQSYNISENHDSLADNLLLVQLMDFFALPHRQPSFAVQWRNSCGCRARKIREGFSWQFPRGLLAIAFLAPKTLRRSQRTSSSKASEALWIDLLTKCAKSLKQLGEEWRTLRVDSAEESQLRQLHMLQSKQQALLDLTKCCPWGDPAETAFVQKHTTLDELTSSHGKATRAIIEYELSRLRWELIIERSNKDAGSAVRLVALLCKTALYCFRLFDIEGAHVYLTEAIQLCEPDLPRGIFDVKLFEDTTKLLAARSFNFHRQERCSALNLVLERLQEIGYTEANVTSATGVSSLSQLAFASMNQRAEESLSSWCQSKDISDEAWRRKIADMVQLFLLHKTIPSQRVYKVLGPKACGILIDHHVLCSTDQPSLQGLKQTDDTLMFASVALWPVDNLVLATDFETTCFSDTTEPAMYLSQDSLALLAAAPRRPVHRVLDLCCGCGIQGLAALKNYAESAVFVDLNPRCLSFTAFNLSLNGLDKKCECLLEQNICEIETMEMQPSQLSLGSFDAILANPPFIPNPRNIATGASLLFGNGGDGGEDVLSCAISFACRHCLPGPNAYFVSVSKAPNVEEFSVRLRSWLKRVPEFHGSAHIFHGPPVPAQEYMPTAISSRVEPVRYQEALEEQGIRTLSQLLLFIRSDTDADTFAVCESEEEFKDFWLNLDLLQQLRMQFEKLHMCNGRIPHSGSHCV